MKRSKGFFKKALDLLVSPQLLIPIWGPTLLAGERAFIHHLGDECPHLEIWHFDPDGARKLPDSVLTSLLTKDTEWTPMLFKNFGKLWKWEQEAKGLTSWWDYATGAWIYHRPVGAVPDAIHSFFDYAEMICGDNEGVWKPPEGNETKYKTAIQEESMVQDALSRVPFFGRESFYQHCENMVKDMP